MWTNVPMTAPIVSPDDPGRLQARAPASPWQRRTEAEGRR